MKTKTLIFIALTGIILTSCEDWGMNCIRGNGDFLSEERSSNYFNKIEVEGSFDVFVSQGSTRSIVVEADENLLDQIVTSTSGDRLIISTRRDRCLRSSNPIEVYITTPDLKDIQLSGSGSLECQNLETPDLNVDLDGSGSIYLGYVNTDEIDLTIDGSGYIDCDVVTSSAEMNVNGSGEMRVSGTTDVADITVSGSGKIRANEMDASDCYATVTGSGDIYAFAFDLLDISITGSGTVYYYGNPAQIVKRITGSGNIIKRD